MVTYLSHRNRYLSKLSFPFTKPDYQGILVIAATYCRLDFHSSFNIFAFYSCSFELQLLSPNCAANFSDCNLASLSKRFFFPSLFQIVFLAFLFLVTFLPFQSVLSPISRLVFSAILLLKISFNFFPLNQFHLPAASSLPA